MTRPRSGTLWTAAAALLLAALPAAVAAQDAVPAAPAAPAAEPPPQLVMRTVTITLTLPSGRGVGGPVVDDEAGLLQDKPRPDRLIRVPAATAARRFAPMPPRLLPPRVTRPPVPMRWQTRKGPRCLPMGHIMGVQAVARGSVDILTREQERLRLELERGCRALDFYAGFYMERPGDAALCRERDTLQARTGERCRVEHIRRLVLVPVED